MELLHEGWFTEFSPDDYAEMQAKALKKQKSSNGDNKVDGNANEADDLKMMRINGTDICGPWTGQCFSLAVDEVLFRGKSKFQDVLVFKSKTYGNVLVLDGVIQTTDRDEFAYQEMLAHLPLFAHPNPKKVLIIGGGDGGILREALKHESVEEVTMCEIDEMVIDVAKKFLPKLSEAFSSPKLKLHVDDGFEFLKRHKNQFDVVITDSSDPVGPAESLFSQNFYSLIKDALRDGGVLSSQAESPWLHLPLISQMVSFNRGLFPVVNYAWSSVPTYPSGSMGYLVASKADRDVSKPARKISQAEVEAMGLQYYNSEVHESAFVLPNFVKKVILFVRSFLTAL